MYDVLVICKHEDNNANFNKISVLFLLLTFFSFPYVKLTNGVSLTAPMVAAERRDVLLLCIIRDALCILFTF